MEVDYLKEKLKVEVELLKWATSIFLLLTIALITLIRSWGNLDYNILNKPSDQVLFWVGLVLDFSFLVYLKYILKQIVNVLQRIEIISKQ